MLTVSKNRKVKTAAALKEFTAQFEYHTNKGNPVSVMKIEKITFSSGSKSKMLRRIKAGMGNNKKSKADLAPTIPKGIANPKMMINETPR